MPARPKPLNLLLKLEGDHAATLRQMAEDNRRSNSKQAQVVIEDALDRIANETALAEKP